MVKYDPSTMAHKEGWRDRFEADLDARLAQGGALYGYDETGRYVVKTRDCERGGEREVEPGTRGRTPR